MSQVAGRVSYLFVNVTLQCNVDCRRCYLPISDRRDAARLDAETLSRLMSHDALGHSGLVVIYQGGEPTLVGRRHLRDLISAVQESNPEARQTLVTNLFNVPSWLPELAHREFGGRIETTFALSGKTSLSGSHEAYLERFARGLETVSEAGLLCPVNIELNRETAEMGVDALAEFMEASPGRHWEFDYSIDPPGFFAEPSYGSGGYPILAGTLTHREFWQFIHDFHDRHYRRLSKRGHTFGLIENLLNPHAKGAFNRQQDHEFLTINPDGSITTGPLFSGFRGSHIGNILSEGVNEVLSNPARMMRAVHEGRRAADCGGCPHYHDCLGGPSHAPMDDGSGECPGGRAFRDYLQKEPER